MGHCEGQGFFLVTFRLEKGIKILGVILDTNYKIDVYVLHFSFLEWHTILAFDPASIINNYNI